MGDRIARNRKVPVSYIGTVIMVFDQSMLLYTSVTGKGDSVKHMLASTTDLDADTIVIAESAVCDRCNSAGEPQGGSALVPVSMY